VPSPSPAPAHGAADAAESGGGTLDEMEREMIARAMRQHGGIVSHVAVALGLSRAALYRRLDRYGLRDLAGSGRAG
jgi:transcriptional regulator of acetoin/glycerol metabolism